MKPYFYFCFILACTIQQQTTAQIWENKSSGMSFSHNGGSVYAADETSAWSWAVEVDQDNIETLLNGTITRTTDAGHTWNLVNFPTSEMCFVTSICALNKDTAWITLVEYPGGIEGDNKVYSTVDGGTTWQEIHTGISTFVDFIFMWNGLEGIVVGDADTTGYEIFRTTDGGKTWTKTGQVPGSVAGDYVLADNYATNGHKLWFVNQNGRVHYTVDKGLSWEYIESPDIDLNALVIEADQSDNLYLALYYYDGINPAENKLFKRNASSDQWQYLPEKGANYYPYDLLAVPGTNILLSSVNDWMDFGVLTRISYDGGASWMDVDSFARPIDMDFYSSDVGYASQANWSFHSAPNRMYRFNGSPVVGLIKQASLPDLQMSISPNPTRGNSTLQITTPSSGDYWIMLHDDSGRLQYKKEIEVMDTYTETLNVSSLPAGIYTLTLAYAQGVESKQLTRL